MIVTLTMIIGEWLWLVVYGKSLEKVEEQVNITLSEKIRAWFKSG
ncbi:MAG: hypothetical protein ABH886_08075 [Candidatus Desantisbacteria bacterium]